MGMRPVAEMQFADFISCAWDHLVTVAAKQRYRAGTPVPITVRLPSGGSATLVRKEVQLAKTEMSQKASRVGKNVGFLVVGGAVVVRPDLRCPEEV